jgi:competence protein ComEC
VQRLIDEARPPWQRILVGTGRVLCLHFGVSLAIWLAIVPLVAARVHVVPPVGIVLGPPLVLLTSVALIAGFLLLFFAAVCPPLVLPCAWVVRVSLSGCTLLVRAGDRPRLGHWYVPDLPAWWLWVLYAGLLGALTVPLLQRRWRWLLTAGVAWLCVGLLSGAAHLPPDELRVTFLAVGHGGCAVLETPDGRTLLYDAGSMQGPEVARRQIAPFLWHRGIRRIDEVFLSHADIDHFNGLVALLDRFAVGKVTYTPTFSRKPIAAVRETLAELHRRGIPVREVKAGDRLTGGGVVIEVLHPPAGPAGPNETENMRSLVLLVRHARHTLLLTGDLEGPGLARLLRLPPERTDVLMAPHHGSRRIDARRLASWARPQVVIACQGPPQWPPRGPDPYEAPGRRCLGTWPHGAITVRSHASGMVIETFLTGERLAVRPAR